MVQMILIVYARTCACAVAVSSGCPRVQDAIICEVVEFGVLDCLWILFKPEVADLSRVIGEVEVKTWSHPIVSIPEDHAGIGLGRQATNRDTVVIQSRTVGLQLLEEIVQVGDRCDLKSLDLTVFRQLASSWVGEVVDVVVSHQLAPSFLVLLQ